MKKNWKKDRLQMWRDQRQGQQEALRINFILNLSELTNVTLTGILAKSNGIFT
jgi:hypothetical protein